LAGRVPSLPGRFGLTFLLLASIGLALARIIHKFGR